MADRTDNVRAYFLDVETHRLMGTSIRKAESAPIGKGLDLSVYWRANEIDPLHIILLGTSDESFFCSRDILQRSAEKLGGEPIFEVPPFAAPCSDGIIIVYALQTPGGDAREDIRGGYVLVPRDLLEEEYEETSIARAWQKADKPTTVAAMLNRLGFGEGRFSPLN